MNTFIAVLGLASCMLLFARFCFLPKAAKSAGQAFGRITVVIPARNEEATLPLLLGDLAAQTLRPAEVLCVDDMSSDATAAVAGAHGAKVISVTEKPTGWTGKSYACQTGAQHAAGELLLFLDADVRLAPTALGTLLDAYTHGGRALSVQPYHCTVRWFEQLSLFFNLIVAASLGARLPFGLKTRGMFGPVILISAEDYRACGGHAGVRGEVLEDIGLGRALDAAGIAYQCFLGGREISFRMYASGPRALVEGWTKNFAAGALGSSPLFIVLISFWMATMFIIPVRLAGALAAGWAVGALVYGMGYLLMVAALFYGAGKVGRFKPAAVAFYPVCLVFFLAIFLFSFYKKLFRRPVRWKGRDIEAGG